MRSMRLLKGVAVSVACWGMILPQARLRAADSKPVTKAPAIVDVALQANGSLSGQVLDEQGLGLEGALVSVRQGKDEIAQTVAGKNGEFAVANLRGGIYQIAAGQGMGLYRLWAPNTAPPSTRTALRLVSKANVFRGQDCCGGCTDWIGIATLGVSIGAVVVSSIALSDINDVEDKVDNLADGLGVEDLPASP